jgi:hypothetical protein
VKRSKAKRETNRDGSLLKSLTRVHGETAVSELARLASAAQSESVKLAAIKELLDRGFGRAPVAQGETAAGVTAHVMVDDGYGD